MGADDQQNEPVQIPITGELDLHTFQPQELRAVLSAYFEACLERGILTVRVIHGKGTGTLRQSVQTELRRNPTVQRYWNADETSGSWGATWVQLRAQT